MVSMTVLIRTFSCGIHKTWRNTIERNHMGFHLEKEVAKRVASDHYRSHARSIAAVNAGLKILWHVGWNGAGIHMWFLSMGLGQGSGLPVRYVTKTWSVVLLNKNYIYSYLKCIVYDKSLKPWQSFWITLYNMYTNCVSEHTDVSAQEVGCCDTFDRKRTFI